VELRPAAKLTPLEILKRVQRALRPRDASDGFPNSNKFDYLCVAM